MTIISPYGGGAHWYRGNLHCHTTESDGGLPPEETVAQYRSAGYDFLAITDHGHLTDVSHLADERFATIRGEELSNPHLVALGIREGIEDRLDFAEQIAAVREQGGLPILAHPAWMGLRVGDIAKQDGLAGMEVYNHICQLLNGKGSSVNIWDELLMNGRQLWGVAADDAHLSTFHPQLQGAWVMVAAEELTEAALLSALEAGCFYSTCGPEIRSVEVKAGEDEQQLISVTCSPCTEVRFVGAAFHGGVVRAPEGELLEGAGHCPLEDMVYCRIECADAQGRVAWSNPLRIGPGAPTPSA